MEEPHKSQSTETIRNEDWCGKCKQSVDEWNVFFGESIHADSGYDKVRRCPHCNAKCFEDDSFEIGCLFFFVGLFGIPLLGLAILGKYGIHFDLEDEGTSIGFFVCSLLAAILLETAVCWVWNRSLYRQKQT